MEKAKIIRVAAYCRVSTDAEDQKNSFESQKRFFERYIKNNSEWELIEIYSDEGITGTNTRKRIGFKCMINDAKTHKFDMIITKEISRFARNTVDTLVHVRELKAIGVGIYFMIEDILSLDDDAEYKITQFASNAQEESHKTSRRVKWGIYAKMEEGFTFGNRVYGYSLENGILTINEEEAKIVRLIFSLYLDEGLGTRRILKYLEAHSVPSPSNKTTWEKTSILRILQNEKYMGTLKQKKEITIDFLSHKRVKNDGIEDFIIIENHHEGIVEKDIFMKVQEEIKRRKNLEQDSRKHTNRYPFSGKIFCMECGSTFHRRYWNNLHEENAVVWQCKENVRNGRKKIDDNGIERGCNNKGIHDIYLKDLFLEAFNKVVDNKDEIIKEVKNTVKRAISQKKDYNMDIAKLSDEINKIHMRRVKLVELYTDGEIDKNIFSETNKQYDKKLCDLREQLKTLQKEADSQNELETRIKLIDKAIQKLAYCEEFSDSIAYEVLDHVDVYAREKICFFLRLIDNSIFFTPDISFCTLSQA